MSCSFRSARRKKLFGQLRRDLGSVFRALTEQKESEILQGNTQPDHVHMLISIPPKYSVANVVGYIKGKSAIHIAREFGGGSVATSSARTSGRGGTSSRQ